MGCGYICFNCGRCRGESKPLATPGICVSFGFENTKGATHCAQCGKSLPLPPGSAADTSDQRNQSNKRDTSCNPHANDIGTAHIV